METKHQYLDTYPISKDSEKLIVGTIHPHDHLSFKVQFFYGNVMSIWTILSDAFPEQLHKPLTLSGILRFLDSHKIAVSDAIRSCQRLNTTANDSDLIVTELNHQMIESIRDSKITEILFTSGFGKNSAFKLFYVDILKKKITAEIRKNKETILDGNTFGRPIKLTILYSPSGAANIGLSKSRIYLDSASKYQESKTPVYDFKVDYYREKFGTNDES